MKKITLTLLLLISFYSNSQERINREKLNFEVVSGVLDNAKGWTYNKYLGEWVEHDNSISNKKDDYIKAQVTQNFISVQTKVVKFQGLTYYVIIVDKENGRYKYPAIFSGWSSYLQKVGYIYSESEYKKLYNLDGLIELKSKLVVTTETQPFDDVKFLDYIQTALLGPQYDFNETLFTITKSKEGKIRFLLPERYSITNPKYDFEKNYFEADDENFSKFIYK